MHFNQAAADWDKRPLSVQVATAVSAAIRREVPLQRHWDALEYGCGTGLVGLELAADVGSLWGFDSAAEMLKVMADKAAAKGFTHVATRCLDLTRDPLPAERFDLIFSCMTLHHVADTALLLQRFRALLKPGGRIAVADLDKEDGGFHAPHIPGVMHHGFERDALRDLCGAAGFSAVAFATAHVIHKQDVQGRERDYPVFLLTAEAA